MTTPKSTRGAAPALGAPAEDSLTATVSLLELWSDSAFLVRVSDGRIVHANRAACELLGHTQSELLSRHYTDIDPDARTDALARAAEERRGGPTDVVWRRTHYRATDGREIPIESSVIPVVTGREHSLLVVGRPSTPAPSAGSVGQADELLHVFDHLGGAVCVVDAHSGEVLRTNAAARRRFGDSGPPRCRVEVPSDTYCPCAQRPLSDCKRCRRSMRCEFETDEGGRHYWNVARALTWLDGRRVCLQVTFDVTERHRLETENLRLVNALHQTAESLVLTDADGTIRYVSPAFERSSGWSAEELLGRTPQAFGSGEHDASFYEQLWATVRSGRVWRGPLRNRRRDGTLYAADVSISPVRDATGAVVNLVAIERDVSADVADEAMLRQSHKLQALSTLADGLSHEFNNLLQPVLGFATTVLESLSVDDERRGQLQAVLRQADRGVELTRRLGKFGHGTRASSPWIDVVSAVREAIRQAAASAPAAVRHQLDIEVPVVGAWADPERVRELVVNLCANGADALPVGGVVRVTVGPVVLGGHVRALPCDVPPGDYALIRVTDDGVGMQLEEIERLFDPFFTTKGRDATVRHSGLGLAVVYGILQRLDGNLRVTSAPGEGTTVEVYLPAGHREVAAPAKAVVAVVDAERQRPTVLVVDDEPDVLELTRVVLAREGYDVLTASDGVEALEVFDAAGGRVDLVLLDVVMPRMRGDEVFRQLRERRPNVRVIFSTGYASDGLSAVVRDAGVEILHKPYAPHELVARVEAALAVAE